MTPTVGRIVHYHATENQKTAMRNLSNCNVQDLLPAIIVAVWGTTTVNLKVFHDGMGDIWVTSSMEGKLEGQWEWPEIYVK